MISSSTVSIRFLVSGPVSSIFCLPTLPYWGSTVGSSTSVAQAMKHAARAELLLELGVLRVVGVLGLLFRVEVVEVAEELVEAVNGRQVLVVVAQVVLAELAARVTVRLEQLGDRRVLLLHTERRAGQADLGEARADGRLADDERSPAGGAALLAVAVGEQPAFLGDAVDVRRVVAHDAVVVAARCCTSRCRRPR